MFVVTALSALVTELYIEDDIPGLVPFDHNGEAIEMHTHEGSIVSPPSYHDGSVIYASSETDGGRLLTTGTLERPPRFGNCQTSFIPMACYW